MGRRKLEEEIAMKNGKSEKPDLKTFTVNGIEFIDISNETYRTYEFANGRVLTIYDPKGINISDSRGHRIITKDGWSLYVKPAEGWFIHWRTNDNVPFQF